MHNQDNNILTINDIDKLYIDGRQNNFKDFGIVPLLFREVGIEPKFLRFFYINRDSELDHILKSGE